MSCVHEVYSRERGCEAGEVEVSLEEEFLRFWEKS